MCGRFVQLTAAPESLYKALKLQETPQAAPRYNLCPTQTASVLRLRKGEDTRKLEPLRWGLIPRWAKDKKIGARMINARAETLASKPSFKAAFRRRRCLIPADGFYEWKKPADKGPKQPYLIRVRGDVPFVFAGLWETWRGEDELIESFTIITTQPNPLCATIHNRMPVILSPENYELWLDPELDELEALIPLLQPFPAELMEAWPVSTLVNKAANNKPACLERLIL